MNHTRLAVPRCLYSWPVAALCVLAIPACMASGVDTAESSAGAQTDIRLRVVAANLTSGNGQDYDLGHGARILDGLDPDVVLIQEFNFGGNTQAELSAFVTDTFGPSYTFFREASGHIPNGVISRYPIVSAGEWEDPYVTDRDFVFAQIDVPGDRDLWAVSVHLLTKSSGVRNDEAEEIRARVLAQVPDGDLFVIGGDFNTKSLGETTFDTLSALVVVNGPVPADQNGNRNTNANRSEPYDQVLADADLQALFVPAVIGSTTFSTGAVIDTRIYNPLSDIAPAERGDSGAPSMQHMAVVKDFVLQLAGDTDAPPPTPDAAPIPDAAPCPGTIDAGIPDAAEPPDAATTPDAPPDQFPGTGVMINEVLANEPGSDPVGEFVELFNSGSAPVSLGGFTLSDSSQVRHVFADLTLDPGERAVIFGGASAIPAGIANAVAASSGSLSLSNSGDDVILADSAGNTVDAITYPDALTDEDGVSMNRAQEGDPSAEFVLHTELSSASSSPGTAP